MYRKIDKPHHVDCCFASERFILQGYDLSLGDYNDWIRLSDHMPIMVDI
jgi:endonuclease/exonuclease/phosphatase family metal-dependent hydrolase